MADLQSARYSLRGAVARWFEQPASAALVRARVTPNMATLTGVALAVGGGVWAGYGEFLIAGVFVFAGAVFDMLDGSIARRTGKAGPQGALMDSVMDRVSEGAVFLGLVVWFSRPGGLDQTGVILGFVAFAGSILVSYVRARAEGLGYRGSGGFLTRPERVVVMVALLIAGQPIWALWILGVGTPLSAAHRFLSAYREAGRSPAGD